MENLVSRIKEIAGNIAETEDKRKKLSSFLRNVNQKNDLNLFQNIDKQFLNDIKIVAIDGGLVKKSFHGFDCVITRAAAVSFHYQKNKIINVDYFPSKNPVPFPEIFETLSDTDFAYSASILRLKMEIETSLKCIDKFEPSIMLLDGSILPHYSVKPPVNSPLIKEYNKLVHLYKELYNKTIEKNIILAGIIEDSRSIKFCKLIKNEFNRLKTETKKFTKLLDNTRDTNLLYIILKESEMTKVFRYSEPTNENIIFNDFKEYGNFIFSFYLKTAKFDKPIRVEFLREIKNEFDYAKKIASVLLSISGQHPDYGLPAPLIEADKVAKLSENEMENLYSRILSFTGNISSIMKLRRETRPF